MVLANNGRGKIFIAFIDKLLDEQFNIEKESKLKAAKELEQKRAISKF